MVWTLPSWLTAFVLPFLWAFVQQLWAQRQRDIAIVNAGAEQQRTAASVSEKEAEDRASKVADAVAHLSDADVAAELARRLSHAG